MKEQDLFEYAVIRVVPKVEREEFPNVGVILYCTKQKFLEIKYDINEDRLSAFCKKTDCGMLREYLDAFEKICRGDKTAGDIAALPIAERFRWLTATRSTVVQTSKVHPGLCHNAAEKLDKLFNELVV